MRRDTPTSLYVQIAGALRRDIAAGRFEPSGRLPSEEELRARFNVSRVTIRLALAELDRENLIDRRKGKGTFTRGKQISHALDTLQSFHEALKAQGFRASIVFLHAKVEGRSPRPDALKLRISRLHVADGKPVAVGVSRIPAALAQENWEKIGGRPLYSIIEKVLKASLVRAEFSVGLESADEDVAELLNVKAGQPLLALRRKSFLADGRCVDDTVFRIRPDRYQFTVSSAVRTISACYDVWLAALDLDFRCRLASDAWI